MGFPVKHEWQVRAAHCCCCCPLSCLQPWTFTSEVFNTTEVHAPPLTHLAARDLPLLQVAGYATQYDVSATGSGSFEFITVSEESALARCAHRVGCAVQVKGGRHEVPETAPQQAFEMLQVMLAGLFTEQLQE
jgi:hypothetical protein